MKNLNMSGLKNSSIEFLKEISILTISINTNIF